ncbi:hypothetical protein TWF281_004139 [Arthrobotrys megalospora]
MTGRIPGEKTEGQSRRIRTADDTTGRLERIRNNQRRSRARRKEYVDALERRLREYEVSDSRDQASTEEMLEYLIKENASLKSILSAIGIDGNLRQELSKAFERVPTLTSVMRATMQQQEDAIPTNLTDDGLDFEVQTPDVGLVHRHLLVDSMQLGQNSDLIQSSTNLFNYIDPGISILESNPTSVELSGIESFSRLTSTTTTTLCSIAYEMVLKFNHKAYPLEELDRRLRCGYSGGYVMDEGCSIDNKVLFRVLGEIC